MKCIDEGYVIGYDNNRYVLAKNGIYQSKRYAEQRCNKLKLSYPNLNFQVVKVKLMIVTEE